MGNCKCTCGNCCSHPKSTEQKNKETQSKFAQMKEAIDREGPKTE